MLKNIKEKILNKYFSHKTIPIVLSVWILSLTAYYCINTPQLNLLSSGRPDTKLLIAETLKFHWVPVFLPRLLYVLYALILNFIAMLIGNRILRWLKVGFDSRINKIVFSIPLGWSVYSIGIFYLGISGMLYVEAVYLFLTLLGILSIFEIERFFREMGRQRTLCSLNQGEMNEVKPRCLPLKSKIDKTDLVFLPIIIIFLAIQLVTSFAPVWAPDTRVYHMALPKLYIRHHALIHTPGFFWSTLPAHTEMLYLLGLITSGETLSKLFSFSISSIFLITIFSIGTKYFSKGVGYLAVIIMIMRPSPFFPIFFSEPWADVALGLFSLLGVYAFFMWMEERGEGYLYLSIVCCALAAATKIQGLFFVLLFFVGFLFTVKRDRQTECGMRSSECRIIPHSTFRNPHLKRLAWCISAVVIVALPWYIRSWWLTGDPFFPFLYDYLGAKHWNEYSNACFWEFHSEWKGAKSFSDFIRINKDVFLSGTGISALPPIIVISLIPALIMFKNWNKLTSRLFFISIVYYIFLIFTSPQIRFFYVALAILSIIVAHFIKTVWTKYLLIRIPIILCIVSISVPFLSFYASVGNRPFFVGLGVLDRRQFLNERLIYRVAIWVNENLPQDSKILSWNMEGYYFDREYIRVAPAFQGVLDFGRIDDAPTFLKSVRELGITHLLYQPSEAWLGKRAKEFLDKCIFELLENRKIALIKQIDSCAIYSIDIPQNYFVLNNNTIRFYDESQRKYLVKGWSSTDAWGTWSEGKESVILVNFTPTLPPSKGEDIDGGKDYTMLIKATGFSVPGKQQSVRIYLDDNLLGEHTFTHPVTYFEDIEIKIPSAYVKEDNQRIRFVYNFTGSPLEYGTGPDVRQLAMGVSLIEFK